MADKVRSTHAAPAFMPRICVIAHEPSLSLRVVCGLAVVVLCLALFGRSQETGAATLHGMVRDSTGKAVAAAVVELRLEDRAVTRTARTDERGNFSFIALHEGNYALRAQMAGYDDATLSSISLGPKEAKKVDVILSVTASRSTPASTQAPEFFDSPKFTVSGVVDTTSLGGHGSDTVARTRDTIARETASLNKTPAGAQPGAAERERALREEVDREPRDFEANHQLGKILLANGKAREAISYLERAAGLNAADYEVAYDLAVANTDAGNYDRAGQSAQALLAHYDKAEVHHLLADVQEKLGDSLRAVREYQRAAEMDPSEPYLFDWGAELLLHHAPEPAQQVFSRGALLFPGSVRLRVGLGAAWFARGSEDEAVKNICEASDLDPDDAAPYLFLGKMLGADIKPSANLVEKLQRFVTRQPENADANYYYGVGLWKRRQSPEDSAVTAQVESLLHHAIRLNPRFGAAFLQLGIVYSEQRDFAKAIPEFRNAIQADPQLEEAHYRLAQAYRQVGEGGKAKAEVDVYDRMVKAGAEKMERERHEIRQFVYTLRDQAPPKVQ